MPPLSSTTAFRESLISFYRYGKRGCQIGKRK